MSKAFNVQRTLKSQSVNVAPSSGETTYDKNIIFTVLSYHVLMVLFTMKIHIRYVEHLTVVDCKSYTLDFCDE